MTIPKVRTGVTFFLDLPRTVQVTRDTSFQVIIEGIWGNPRASGYIAVDDVTFYDGECEAVPATANVVKGVCSFDRDSCGWRNTSTAETFDWRQGSLLSLVQVKRGSALIG